MRRQAFRLIAILCASLHLAACSRWAPTAVAPQTLIEQERPYKVLVLRSDGAEVEVPKPIIRSDSIVTGEPCERIFTPDGRAECASPPAAVALSEVHSVHVRERSLGLGPSLLLVPVFLFGLWAACNMDDGCLYGGS